MENKDDIKQISVLSTLKELGIPYDKLCAAVDSGALLVDGFDQDGLPLFFESQVVKMLENLRYISSSPLADGFAKCFEKGVETNAKRLSDEAEHNVRIAQRALSGEAIVVDVEPIVSAGEPAPPEPIAPELLGRLNPEDIGL